MSTETMTVITCGRCGRENRGTPGPWLDNGIYGPGSWEESGWIYLTPAEVEPLEKPTNGRLFVCYSRPDRSEFVCPRCVLEEERWPDERYRTISCFRCGRENRGKLGDYPRQYCVDEWDEPGWVSCRPGNVEALDEVQVWGEVTIGRGGKVCPGCLTAEENEQLEAIEWNDGDEESPAA